MIANALKQMNNIKLHHLWKDLNLWLKKLIQKSWNVSGFSSELEKLRKYCWSMLINVLVMKLNFNFVEKLAEHRAKKAEMIAEEAK